MNNRKRTDHLPTFRKKKLRKRQLRVLMWFSPVVALLCLVTAIHLVSYEEQRAQQQQKRNEWQDAQDGEPGLVIQAGEDTKVPGAESTSSASDYVKIEQEPLHTSDTNQNYAFVAADEASDIYITPKMTYTLEIYDARTDQFISEEISIPHEMYGLNREELEQYLVRLAATENEGLSETQYHYQIQSFSRKAFTVRRTITARQVNYAIFLIAENGLLTAYNGERTEIYERTEIPLGDFPLEQQAMLTQGIYMKTLTDYYDFLETYSS